MKALHPLWMAVFLASLVLVTAGSLATPASLPPLAFDLWDKAQHAMAFGWLTGTGLRAWRDSRHRLLIGIGLAAWGGVIELLQAASGYRHGDWADLGANLVGILMVSGIHRMMRTNGAAPPADIG